ncbi:hypothetical protein [Spirosoma areae]
MEPKQEKWVNDILNSIDGVQRAEPNPFLFAKIRNRLTTEPMPVYVSVRVIWGTVLSFALLLLLNWRVINQPVPARAVSTDDLNAVVSEMQLTPISDQLDNVWSEHNY